MPAPFHTSWLALSLFVNIEHCLESSFPTASHSFLNLIQYSQHLSVCNVPFRIQVGAELLQSQLICIVRQQLSEEFVDLISLKQGIHRKRAVSVMATLKGKANWFTPLYEGHTLQLVFLCPFDIAQQGSAELDFGQVGFRSLIGGCSK